MRERAEACPKREPRRAENRLTFSPYLECTYTFEQGVLHSFVQQPLLISGLSVWWGKVQGEKKFRLDERQRKV